MITMHCLWCGYIADCNVRGLCDSCVDDPDANPDHPDHDDEGDF